jgi:SAM-dependent methyltransferase
MSHYGDTSYWITRYKTSSAGLTSTETPVFDWYCPYAATGHDGVSPVPDTGFRANLIAILSTMKNPKILVVGCGMSSLGEMLYDDDFKDVTCIDISPDCIERMDLRRLNSMAPTEDVRRKKVPIRESLVYTVCDVRNLVATFGKGSFDVIIDKALVDALYCGGVHAVDQAVLQIYETLKDGGVFVHISCSDKTTEERSYIFGNPLVPWAQVVFCSVDVLPKNDPAAVKQVGDAAVAEMSKFLARPYFLYTLRK